MDERYLGNFISDEEREKFFIFARAAFGEYPENPDESDTWADRWRKFRHDFFEGKLVYDDDDQDISYACNDSNVTLTDYNDWCKARGTVT